MNQFKVGDIVRHVATGDQLIILDTDYYESLHETRYVVRLPRTYTMARDIRAYELEAVVKKDDTAQ